MSCPAESGGLGTVSELATVRESHTKPSNAVPRTGAEWGVLFKELVCKYRLIHAQDPLESEKHRKGNPRRQKRKEGREGERKGRKEHLCKCECLSSLLFLLCSQAPTPTESQCPAPKSTALSLPGLGALASTATPAELTVRSSRLMVSSLARAPVGLAGHSFPPRRSGGSMTPGATRGPPT